MEERIIDDEYGRGVRLRKTKDGYVDVTDELAPEAGEDSEELEEIAFEFPTLRNEEGEEFDDEDLVDLSPEEAERVRKEKAAALARRQEAYESACREGEKLLETGSYHAAELAYEKALKLDETATEASVGYWRAKTADFTDPDALVSEYLEGGIENLEFDLGYEAADIVKRDYRGAFEKRLRELEEEEAPLVKEVEEKQNARREILSVRRMHTGIAFLCTALPLIAAVIATVIVGMKNFTTLSGEYVTPTIVLACISVAIFVGFGIATNKFVNACRIYRMNERVSSTEDGLRLLEIREYKDLYEALLLVPQDMEEGEAGEEAVEEADGE